MAGTDDDEAAQRAANVSTGDCRLVADGKVTGWPALARPVGRRVVERVRKKAPANQPSKPPSRPRYSAVWNPLRPARGGALLNGEEGD